MSFCLILEKNYDLINKYSNLVYKLFLDGLDSRTNFKFLEEKNISYFMTFLIGFILIFFKLLNIRADTCLENRK